GKPGRSGPRGGRVHFRWRAIPSRRWYCANFSSRHVSQNRNGMGVPYSNSALERSQVHWTHLLATRVLVFACLLFLAALCATPAHAQCTRVSPCASAPTSLGTLRGGGSHAFGVSDDGTVVVGRDIGNDRADHAFRWTRVTGMKDLFTLGGRNSD